METTAEISKKDEKIKYDNWKINSFFLYDFIYPQKLEWPSTSCKWGDLTYQNHTILKQDLYFGCRTDGKFNEKNNSWDGMGSLLVLAQVDIPLPGYRIERSSGIVAFKSSREKRSINVKQVLLHPGEVNTIRPWSKNKKIIATHSDSKDVYIWDVSNQINASDKKDTHANIPEIILHGHTDLAPYAVAWSRSSPILASGGYDKKVVVWDLESKFSSSNELMLKQNDTVFENPNRIFKNLQSYLTDKQVKTPEIINETMKLEGHTANIEAVVFHPFDDNILCSVSIDKNIIIWDRRATSSPSYIISDIHNDDINCVDWSAFDSNYLCTGSSDCTAVLLDIRKAAPVTKMRDHKSSVTCVEFSPLTPNIVASSDRDLFIWSIKEETKSCQPVFKHLGHRCPIVDFEWNQHANWTIVSVSDDSENPSIGGGTLNVFRPFELLLNEKEKSLEKINQMDLKKLKI